MKNQLYHMYVASCEKEGGIYHYQGSDDETLQFVSYTKLDRPMYMVICGQKMHILLRAPFENEESGLVTYDINCRGILENPTEIFPTGGKGACHLAKSGADIYCVNYWSGNIIRMPYQVQDHNGLVSHARTVRNNEKRTAHTHFVGETPDGQYLFITDLGLDKIMVYNKDLTMRSVVDMPLGCGPRHLAYHENGTTVFCANELQSSVSVLTYTDGILRLSDTVTALPADYCGKNAVAAIRCRGNQVFVSNRGHDSIAVFHYSSKGLVLKKTVSTYGSSPRDFWKEGEYFFCANEKSDNVTIVSKENGSLLSEIKVKAPLCICIKKENAQETYF